MAVVGVVGTMVWDTIWHESDRGTPTGEWGGICYALAAAQASYPPDFMIRPVLKLGRDLAEQGLRFLNELSVIETDEAVSTIDAPGTRVELRYMGQVRSCERIRGVPPSWTWSELEPRLRGCDALYVNFVTGSEFDLTTALELRRGFRGPIYADIHSLTLATGPSGERSLRPLRDSREWLECFDVVQVNEDELGSIAASEHLDPWEFARSIVGRKTRLLFVTLGSGGASYVVARGALPLSSPRSDDPELPRTGSVTVERVDGGDPTGCGDVWGITSFGSLLAGRDVEDAVRIANGMARRNVFYRGASGLGPFLRGAIESA